MSRKGGMFKFAAGIGLGVGLGMLLSPKKGEELRKDLKVKLNELLEEAKKIDVKEVANNISEKVTELKKELEELDKEKAIELAKKKGEDLKVKAGELLDFAKEKGTPILEKAAKEVKTKAVLVTKEVLKKLEASENKEKNN